MQKQSFSLGNVHCSACEAKLTQVLKALSGIEEVSINLERKTMLLTFDEEKLGVGSIVSHVQQAGYEAIPTRFEQNHDDFLVKTQEVLKNTDGSSLKSTSIDTEHKREQEKAESETSSETAFPLQEDDKSASAVKELKEQGFMLNKVHCASCQGKIYDAVMRLAGVAKVNVDTLRKSVVITYDSEKISQESIEKHFAGTKYAMKAVEKSAFLPLIPPISAVKQKKIPQSNKTVLPTLQNNLQDSSNSDEQNFDTDVKKNAEENNGHKSTETDAESDIIPVALTELEKLPEKATQKLQKQDFNIGNVHCTSCEAKVVKLLTAMNGIEKVSVNVLRKTMRVEYESEKIQSSQISSAMEKAGYTATALGKTEAESGTASVALNELQKLPQKLQRQDFNIGNVHCTSCEAKVVKLLTAMNGIEKVSVNVLRKNMLVNFDSEKIQVSDIVSTMEKAGYTATPFKGIMEFIHGQNVAQPSVKQNDFPENKEGLQESVEQKDIAEKGLDELTAQAKEAPSMPTVPGIATENHEQPSQQPKVRNKDKNESIKRPNFWRNWPFSLIFSLIFASILMYVAMAPMFSLPVPSLLDINKAPFYWAAMQALLTLPILLINGRIFISGFRGIMTASPNMDSLVGLGSGTAALFGLYALWRIFWAQENNDFASLHHYVGNLYFDSAGMILALIGLGKFFESKARERTGSAIDALMRLSPPTATVLRNGEEIVIASHEVQQGDILIVQAGQILAADGIITQGSAFIDTSVITGESLPQKKSEGDSVIGATMCKSGYFQMQVTAAGDNSILAQIIELVETATASKAPIAKLADRISAIFVPIIIAIAILSFALWMLLGQNLEFALSTAISVLVISCPCALGLATPTAIMVGMGMGAEHGILFKSAAAIERMQNINTVVLDKTGTLTHGKPEVTDLIPVIEIKAHKDVKNASDPFSAAQTELLRIAASLEKLSEHPLGHAIVLKAKEDNVEFISPEKLSDFIQMPGLGISAMHGDEQLLAGNARLLAKENILNPLVEKEKELARMGKTVLYFARGTTLLGLIAVADAVKETSRTAVQNLKGLGLNVLMLTGDNALTAKVVQEQVDIENIFAEVLPHEKEEKVRELQEAGHKVIMVGDGINDAPALARAHVGIAIGQGTDIAMQSSDVVLMQSDVAHVSQALKLSKAVMRTIKQNLFWAFAYNTLLIPVAAGVFYGFFGLTLNPMLAAASMSLSSITVVGNALRLRLQGKRIFVSSTAP